MPASLIPLVSKKKRNKNTTCQHGFWASTPGVEGWMTAAKPTDILTNSAGQTRTIHPSFIKITQRLRLGWGHRGRTTWLVHTETHTPKVEAPFQYLQPEKESITLLLNANKDTCRSTARCCAAQRVLQPKGRLKTFIPIKATFFFKCWLVPQWSTVDKMYPPNVIWYEARKQGVS